MQLAFNSRTITPTSYEGKNGIGFNATLFVPEQYSIRVASAGMMPAEQMKAVLEQAAQNVEPVEIQFMEGSTKYGKYLEIYSVKHVKK